MVKSVSCCCVLGSQLFSNPVTFVKGFEFIQVVNYAGKVCQMVSSVLCITVFIRIKAGLKYTQGLKYTPGSAAE